MLSAEDVGFKVIPSLLVCPLQGGWVITGMALQIHSRNPDCMGSPDLETSLQESWESQPVSLQCHDYENPQGPCYGL